MSLHAVHIPTGDEEAAANLRAAQEFLLSAQARLSLLSGIKFLRGRLAIGEVRDSVEQELRILEARISKEVANGGD